MRATLLKQWHEIVGSYWFIPTVMAVAAITLSFVMVALDRRVGAEWLSGVAWLYVDQPAGARAVLSTIAGSMITVAGVTFSITIATVAQATSHFGPRLLTNFMHDRGNQITLGTFIATFLYGLMVLRSVQSAVEGGAQVDFVPNLSIMGALLLALASLGVLIYFIHHIPDSIHISNMVANAGRLLQERLVDLFPADIGQEAPEPNHRDTNQEILARLFQDAMPVRAGGDGYVQQIDGKGLLDLANAQDLVLWLHARPGVYVNRDTVLVLAKPLGERREDIDEKTAHRIRRSFAWGAKRTPAQDVMFLADQLVEIAIRALSPGINDPFTAIHCLSWLSSALVDLAGRDTPGMARYDGKGRLRILARGYGFSDFADSVFNQLRPYVQKDRNAACHMLTILADIALSARTDDQRCTLSRHADALKRGCELELTHESDLESVEREYQRACLCIHRHPGNRIFIEH